MDAGTVLTVLVGIIAAAMILQAIAILVFVLSLRKYFGRLEVLLTQVTRDLQPILQSAREILADTKEKVNSISANLLEITGMVRGQVARVDGILTEASDRARAQFIRLDQLLTDTISRVEETGAAVRQAVMTPVREISAILAGVRTALDYLFRRNKAGVERATQDEELFI